MNAGKKLKQICWRFSDFVITSKPLEIAGEENREDTAKEQTNNTKTPAYLPAILLVGILLLIGIAEYVLKIRAKDRRK